MTFEKYIALHEKKKAAEAKVSEIKAEIADAEKLLLERFEADGMSSVKVGDRTLWLDHKLWASAGGDVEGAVAALEQSGFGELVSKTINRNSLSAWIREQAGPLDTPEQVMENLPHGLGKAIKVTETNNIRVRGL